jgi:hypothetical protein
MDFLLLGSALRQWSVLPVSGLLKPGAGSFTPGMFRSSGLYLPRLDSPPPHPSTGPSPAARAFAPARGAAPGSAPQPLVLTAFLSPVPRSDSWPRVGWNFARRLSPHLPPGGSRVTFAFAVARPFVCGCRTLSPIPLPRTLPGLPGSRVSLPHRVARPHHGPLGGNPTAFASIVQARPFPSLGRPVPRQDGSC